MGIIGAVSTSNMTRSRKHKDIYETTPVNQDTREADAAHILQPTCSLCHERHQGTNQCPSGGCSMDVLCRPLPSQLHFQSGPAPRPACRAPFVVSHRGVYLQLTELNLALTLPVVSVALGPSWLVQGGVFLLQM